MGDIEHGVWHKDGPVAQIEAMIEWLNDPLDAEHRRKVQKNLGASADALRGAVERIKGLRERVNDDDPDRREREYARGYRSAVADALEVLVRGR